MWTRSASRVPGRRRANGPMRASGPISAPSATQPKSRCTRSPGVNPVAGAGREAHHVGEIELALRVVRSELGEEPEEQLCAGGVETWVDLGDGTLDVARVPLFDDAGDLAVESADDSAIAGGPCEVERHQRQVRARGAVGIEQGAERSG